MQNSINNMRDLTGGNSQDASSGGAVQYVNRKLSPYNSPSASSFAVSTSVLSRFSSLPQIDLVDPGAQSLIATSVRNASTLVSDGGVAIVTSDSTDVLQAGIPIYVNTIGIATADAFMTIFLVALIYAAIVSAILGLGYLLYFYASRRIWGKRYIGYLPGLQFGYLPFARAWGLRAALITILPITVFAFYQWTLKDSWLSVLLSVITLVILMALVFPSLWLVLRGVLRRSNEAIPSSLSLTPLVSPFRQERIYYIVVLLLAVIAKSMITAFGHAHGLVQSILCLIVEIVLLVSLIILKPYRTRHADILQGFLAIVRVVCSGLFIAFAESLALMAIPRTAIGIVAAVIFSIAVLVMFFNILVNLGLWRLVTDVLCCGKRRRKGDRALTSKDSNFMFGKEDAEKGQDSSGTTPGSSQFFLIRPGNPTPPATDVGALTPVSANSEQPSMFSSATTTSTLGETLPRRWSFQHSRPPSSSELSPTTGGSFVTPSPSSPSSRLPSQRHSRHPSSSAPAPIVEHQFSEENAS
ncbi:uncharacterized protein FIBRA_05732 [Fibroporia radiculosa]|uniref:TRP C-terminal domain-containing protein n=1 Tax=Fibroporia radiculosa TaxID=599839 RepID=J4H3P3_9APHY|nr:uncharacterized protein FIBRA_05732 [Fibroporia radiculosa]CCM03594.1 predicted protein [Fibroporia radiculosa]